MAKQNINIGSQANDRSGDPLRTAFDKINQNFTELYNTASLDIQIPVQTGNVGKYLTTNGSVLSWSSVASGTTDRLTNGLNEVVLGATGVMTDAGGSFIKTTTNSLASTVLTQIVWTATETFISGAKLTIQVECEETGGTGNWETQVCEAIIAVRGWDNTSVPVISVYGVTHTSAAPLMTFTVDRNLVSNLVEIVGTRTATATTTGNASLRIYSVETGTMD